jgi:hypothetical protein
MPYKRAFFASHAAIIRYNRRSALLREGERSRYAPAPCPLRRPSLLVQRGNKLSEGSLGGRFRP